MAGQGGEEVDDKDKQKCAESLFSMIMYAGYGSKGFMRPFVVVRVNLSLDCLIRLHSMHTHTHAHTCYMVARLPPMSVWYTFMNCMT